MSPRAHRVSEKVEQAQLIKLYASVGGTCYVLGTRRAKPPKGLVLDTREQQRQWYATRQTPGLADLFVILPARFAPGPDLALWHEAKAVGGRLSPDQRTFRERVIAAGMYHVAGGYDAGITFLLDHGYLKASGVPHYRLPAEAVT